MILHGRSSESRHCSASTDILPYRECNSSSALACLCVDYAGCCGCRSEVLHAFQSRRMDPIKTQFTWLITHLQVHVHEELVTKISVCLCLSELWATLGRCSCAPKFKCAVGMRECF